MKEPTDKKLLTLGILAIAIIFIVGLSSLVLIKLKFFSKTTPGQINTIITEQTNLKKFTSDSEFKDYIQKSQQESVGSLGTDLNMRGLAIPGSTVNEFAPALGNITNSKSADSGPASNFSQTNVQVAGIDEPDIVKTDGKNIFVSTLFPNIYYRGGPVPFIMDRVQENMGISTKIMPPNPIPSGGTKIISAFPPTILAKTGSVESGGNILIKGKILTILKNTGVVGYDVTNPSSPTQKWNLNYENNSQYVTARLLTNKIYLVTRLGFNYTNPCPIIPMSLSGSKISIPCLEIYHPISITPVDSTFTISVINIETGTIEKQITTLGSGNNTVIYMSYQNLYLTNTFSPDPSTLIFNFLSEKGQGLIDTTTLTSLELLKNINISNQSKMVEIQIILERYLNGLASDDRLKIENEIQNRMTDYQKEHKRDMEKTGIVKINLNPLNIDATGEVPGRLLNQFSIDEYQNNLRIATTVGGNSIFGMGGQNETANDVYILQSNMKVAGSVINLGVGERIYSVRFIADRGYVVTFKQTDPFYVLDLSNTAYPVKKGELKIPGFSSYLDPLDDNLILGVGQENSKVKLSLFDVTNPQNPVELDKYDLAAYWTEVSQDHHAFSKIPGGSNFFLPTNNGGYVFSYLMNKLKLEKAIDMPQIKRAIFMEDKSYGNFLYAISDAKIEVYNQNTWQAVAQINL